MAESKTKSAPQAEAAAAEGGLLDQIISKSRIARTDSERDRTRDLIGELVGQVMDGQLVVSRDAIASLDARVADIDKLISDQLSAVIDRKDVVSGKSVSVRVDLGGRRRI